MLAMVRPMMVVSVELAPVWIVAADVPTPVSVTSLNAFAIYYSISV
jgi:hypothetical protein